MKDYYAILGLDKTATDEQIKKAFRKMAIKFHPDKNPGDKEAEEKFKEINEANSILSDPDKKSRYDSGGMSGSNQSYEDLMRDMFSQFNNMSNFGFGGFNQRGRRGDDIRMNIALELSEILSGVNKKIKYKRNTHCNTCKGTGAKGGASFSTCQKCNGSGRITSSLNIDFLMSHTITMCDQCNGNGKIVKEHCNDCIGSGVITMEETIEISIPPGISEGMQFVMQNYGNFPNGPGAAGSLIILITENKDVFFKRVGNNIHCDVFISLPDAILGNDNIEVKTIDGRVKIKIDPGTENGKVLRLSGKGLPSANNPTSFGDQFIHINIFIPKSISVVEQNIFKDLQDSKSFKVDNTKTQGIKGMFERMNEFKNLF